MSENEQANPRRRSLLTGTFAALLIGTAAVATALAVLRELAGSAVA